MEDQIPGLLFFLKKPKKKADKTSKSPTLYYVYQRITVNGDPKEISLRRKWEPARWSQKIGRATDAKEDAKCLNQLLDSITAKFNRAQRFLIDADKDLTSAAIKAIVSATPVPPRTLISEFAIHNEIMYKTIGLEDGYAEGTYQRFQTAKDHTENFIKWKYGQDDLNLKSLDYAFISDYFDYLRTVKNCNYNTSIKYLTNMKKVVIRCYKRGYINGDPFIAFPLSLKEVKKIALSIEELKRLMEKQFLTFRLSFVRDMFVFSCFTGLAYSDVKKLKRADIVVKDGIKWIITPRTKTKRECKIPIMPQAQAILDKYINPLAVAPTDRVVAITSNQKVNEYLKEIADLCAINKKMTFHIARHTFATTITLRYGIPLHVVSQMMGHKILAQTQHYAITHELQIAEEMKALPAKIDSALAAVA